MELYVMIGLPGSGKTTMARQIAEETGAHVVSTDVIRKEYSVDNPFDIVRVMIESRMKEGQDIIYDATNLTTGNRATALELAKKYGYETTAVVMLTPLERCKKQNREREAVVPEEVIDKFLRRFEYPYEGEFDNIRPVQCEVARCTFEDIDQDSVYHTHTLMGHMSETGCIVKKITKDWHLIMAAFNHDIGKPITKSYINSKGEKTEHAHYYGHENAGSYIWFTTNKWSEDVEEIGRLINYHMRPYVWTKSRKATDKDRKRFTDKFLAQLTILHMGDEGAH